MFGLMCRVSSRVICYLFLKSILLYCWCVLTNNFTCTKFVSYINTELFEYDLLIIIHEDVLFSFKNEMISDLKISIYFILWIQFLIL